MVERGGVRGETGERDAGTEGGERELELELGRSSARVVFISRTAGLRLESSALRRRTYRESLSESSSSCHVRSFGGQLQLTSAISR